MSHSQLRILTIDGGGIRGVIPAVILARIEQETGRPIAELFDVIAGTSTGGILTLGLTIPDASSTSPAYSADQLVDLYQQHGAKIFKKKRSIGFFNSIGSLFNETYGAGGIEDVLKEYFGDTKLSQCLSDVLITSYDLESARTFIFKSRLARKSPDTEDFFVRDVARSTSAAPTYFSPKQVKRASDQMALIDGGVFANNPSTLAFAEAKEILRKSGWDSPTPAVPANEEGTKRDFAGDAVEASDASDPLYMLSLGTGSSHKPITFDAAKKWGMIKWVKPIIHIMMQGNSESVHYQMRRLLPPRLDRKPRYDRLNVDDMHPDHIAMDDVSEQNIARLKKYADDFVASHEDKIETVCRHLTS